jgi:cardiolipin synthase
MRQWWNVANLLTAVRLLLAPFIARAILDRRHALALTLFLIAGTTDILDGTWARRFGSITQAGAYLDPIADKILLSSIYISLAAIGSVPWWFVGIIFGRDLFLLASSGAAILFTRMRRFPPSAWGKVSTFCQISTGVTFMVRNAVSSPALEWLAAALIWPTVLITVGSGIHYGWRGARWARTH